MTLLKITMLWSELLGSLRVLPAPSENRSCRIPMEKPWSGSQPHRAPWGRRWHPGRVLASCLLGAGACSPQPSALSPPCSVHNFCSLCTNSPLLFSFPCIQQVHLVQHSGAAKLIKLSQNAHVR